MDDFRRLESTMWSCALYVSAIDVMAHGHYFLGLLLSFLSILNRHDLFNDDKK